MFKAAARRMAPHVLASICVLGCGHALAQGTLLRIACDDDNAGAEVSINGQFKGVCPLDTRVPAGTVRIEAIKKVDAQRERAFAQDMRVGDGVTKRIEIELGPIQLNAEGRRLELETAARAEQARLALLEKLRSEAAAGSAEAAFQLGARYENGTGLEKDLGQATVLYRQAAQAGLPAGMGAYGAMLNNGSGVEKNLPEALAWWRKGAALGDGRSLNGLSIAYDTGLEGLVEKDAAKSLDYLKRASETEPRAMYRLGWRYSEGIGVPKDYAHAMELYRRAAALGHADAMGGIGYLYGAGVGVPRDVHLALEWHRRAAEKGSPIGMNNLALCYESGTGMPANRVLAIEWMRKAVAAGYPPSKDHLARLLGN